MTYLSEYLALVYGPIVLIASAVLVAVAVMYAFTTAIFYLSQWMSRLGGDSGNE